MLWQARHACAHSSRSSSPVVTAACQAVEEAVRLILVSSPSAVLLHRQLRQRWLLLQQESRRYNSGVCRNMEWRTAACCLSEKPSASSSRAAPPPFSLTRSCASAGSSCGRRADVTTAVCAAMWRGKQLLVACQRSCTPHFRQQLQCHFPSQRVAPALAPPAAGEQILQQRSVTQYGEANSRLSGCQISCLPRPREQPQCRSPFHRAAPALSPPAAGQQLWCSCWSHAQLLALAVPSSSKNASIEGRCISCAEKQICPTSQGCAPP